VIGYAAKRVGSILMLGLGISIVVFLIIRLIPGDPAVALLGTNAGDPALVARLRQQLGLDEPLTTQYLHWIGGVLRGDFGYSYGQQRSVASLIGQNLPPTLALTAASLAISVVFGTLVGVLAALRRNTRWDTLATGVSLVFLSIPSFWLGLVLIVVFAVHLHWFNVFGGSTPKGTVLPAVTLGLSGVGFVARFVRSSVIDAARRQHVVTARAKGLSPRQVLTRHVMRNALLPVLTVIGMLVGNLLSGAVVIETVFSRPGIGRLLVNAILSKDYLTVQAVVLIVAVMYAATNLLVDLLYPVLDPRIARR
jgi:ABC-type dipeptide/oligopeptide/nickel transport system permease component